MTFEQELYDFNAEHRYRHKAVGKAVFRCLLEGDEKNRTLVFFNGGMNCSEMWLRYVEPLKNDFRVLLFDYPVELKTAGELTEGINAFLKELKIERPVLIGAGDGGIFAQLYARRYPGEVYAMVLASSAALSEETLKSMKKRNRFPKLSLWYLRHCNYNQLKPILINSAMQNVQGESRGDQNYAYGMFKTLFKDYTREKDVHISALLVDLLRQTPVKKGDFESLHGRILLILPGDDYFTAEERENLMYIMDNPETVCIPGSHIQTVLKADEYISAIRSFLASLPDTAPEPSAGENG